MVTDAMIAFRKGGDASVREIKIQYREDAESFWRDMTGAHEPDNPDDEDEEERGHAGRRALQRAKTWHWLLANEYPWMWVDFLQGFRGS